MTTEAGGNYGIVVRLPQIVADDRLVYFDHNKTRGSWVIRDFVGGRRLDNDHSTCTVPQIEADATYDEISDLVQRRDSSDRLDNVPDVAINGRLPPGRAVAF